MTRTALSPADVGEFNRSIRDGDIDAVKGFVNRWPSIVNEPATTFGGGYLHYAASEGQRDLTEFFLAQGLPIDGIDENADTPLVLAADSGDARTIRFLLDAGAAVDGVDVGRGSPLISTAIEGHLEAARMLVDAGAEVNREGLGLPLTALGFARYYAVKETGQDAVAEYLEAQGGIDPFNGPSADWARVRGQAQIEAIEATLGRVHPVPFTREVRAGDVVTVHRTRYSAEKYLFHLLFTVDLALHTGFELAVCLHGRWPVHQRAFQKSLFRWPLDLLFALARAALEGQSFEHGEVVARAHPALVAVDGPERLAQWLLVKHASFEIGRERRLGAAPMLLLVPHTLKTPIKPGRDALARANKKAETPWTPPAAGEGRNALVVPICFDAPWHTPK